MKLKKTILGLAVVAVAGVNVWLANENGLFSNSSNLAIGSLENAAEAAECKDEIYYSVRWGSGSYYEAGWYMVTCDNSNDDLCPLSTTDANAKGYNQFTDEEYVCTGKKTEKKA